jgi:hypothetical protein
MYFGCDEKPLEPREALPPNVGGHGMRVLGVGLLLAFLALATHWVVWRIRIPQRQTAALLLIFLATLTIGLLAVATVTGHGSMGGPWLRGGWEYAHVAIWHVAFMLAYIVAYSAIEERSPSMTLLCRVADAKSPGPTTAELQETLRAVSPVEIRLANMLRDGMVGQDGEDLYLLPKGHRWVAVFSRARTFLGLPKGG